MLDVQIVIPSINLWTKYTKNCIESVVKSSESAGIKYRVLLIDNQSTDETSVEAGKLVSETFSHYRSPTRMSFSESVNFGVNDGFSRDAKYILVLNNDTILREDTIERLLQRFTQKEQTAIEERDSRSIEPPVIILDNTVMVSCLNVRGECSVEDMKYSAKICDESEHPDFSGFMINKECWDKVGQFDENFKPAYFEDNDYHYRIKLLGLKAICYPQAIYYHFGSGTQNEAEKTPIVAGHQFLANANYYANKWGGKPGKETYTKPFNQ